MSETDPQPKPEVSEKKRAANKANAKKSTGPRTPEGKKRVSLNALTHGLTARAAVLPFENADHFEKFAAALRAELRPAGFLQTLLSERIIDAAWKLRRASRAQSDLACRLLDDDLHEHEVAVEGGAYDGPYVPISGAWIVSDAADGGEAMKNSPSFLKLDLYADRLQRALLGALTRLRREQDRAAKAGEVAAAADVEVELGDDAFENATMKSKPTGGEAEEEEIIDLRVFIRDPSAKMSGRDGAAANNSNSQNKPTATAKAPPGTAPSPTHEAGAERESEAPAELRAEPRVDPRAAPHPEARPPGPGESNNEGGDAPAGAGGSSGAHVQRDSEPWRDLPPWHPMRARAG